MSNRTQCRHVTFKDYKKLFRNPSFVLDTAGMTCLTFALGGIAYWMPIYLLQYRQMGYEGCGEHDVWQGSWLFRAW